MYLEGQHVDNGWIRSTFTLTHRVSWEQMLQAIYAAFDYFTEIVIFVDEKKHRITSRCARAWPTRPAPPPASPPGPSGEDPEA